MKIKIEVSDDTTTSTITKDFTRWTDVFPDFLNALRGAGFSIDPKVAVYMPGEMAERFGSGDGHILYDSDLVQENSPEDEMFNCDLCNQQTPDPWHYSTESSRHNHACDACAERIQIVATDHTFVHSCIDKLHEELDQVAKDCESGVGERLKDEITRLAKEVDMEKAKEECQKIEKQLSEPKQVEVIPLGEGKELRWVSIDYLNPSDIWKRWGLFQGETMIRHLDQYEMRIVEAALKAQQLDEATLKQIAEALRQHGLTLIKKANGYAVMKLGNIEAQ